MESHARSLAENGRHAWVILEGASDGLGFWGYLTAAEELATQLGDLGLGDVTIWHAASSGGTTAGLAAGRTLTSRLAAISVSDPVAGLEERITSIWDDVFADSPERPDLQGVEIRDDYLGEGYGLSTAEELESQAQASALSGLLFDPTYTGKAVHALRSEIARGGLDANGAVVFWHTGGGFAAFALDPPSASGP